MAIGYKLEKLLNKKYPPQERVDAKFMRYDISFVTNELGEPVTLFIGMRNEKGEIVGDRYVRRIVRKPDSDAILKSHWDLKGRVKG